MRIATSAGLGLILAVSCALAGCGDSGQSQNGVASGGGTPTTVATTEASGGSSDLTTWTKCLRDNGIDVQDPDPGTGRIDLPDDSPALDAAMEKCKQYNTGSSGSTGADPNDPQQMADRRKFAKCMRDSGVDWPDPVAGQPMQVPEQTPQLVAALQKCMQEVPVGGGK